MKGRNNILFSSFFVFTVIILLLRPVIIYGSNSLQSFLSAAETKAFGIRSIVKKRRDTVRLSNIISKENEDITIINRFSSFFLFFNKKWLSKILTALSFLLSQFTLLLKKRATLFEIVPDNHHYLALSVIRI